MRARGPSVSRQGVLLWQQFRLCRKRSFDLFPRLECVQRFGAHDSPNAQTANSSFFSRCGFVLCGGHISRKPLRRHLRRSTTAAPPCICTRGIRSMRTSNRRPSPPIRRGFARGCMNDGCKYTCIHTAVVSVAIVVVGLRVRRWQTLLFGLYEPAVFRNATWEATPTKSCCCVSAPTLSWKERQRAIMFVSVNSLLAQHEQPLQEVAPHPRCYIGVSMLKR